MANPKGNPGNLIKPWKKGQSGNPSGRKAMDEDLKKVKKLSADEIERLIAKVGRLDLKELLDRGKDGSISVLEAMVCRVAAKSLQHGDHAALNFLFDRSVGKVLEAKAPPVAPVTYSIELDSGGSLVQDVLEAEASTSASDSPSESSTEVPTDDSDQ